jgi:hypothetical protein
MPSFIILTQKITQCNSAIIYIYELHYCTRYMILENAPFALQKNGLKTEAFETINFEIDNEFLSLNRVTLGN